MFYSHSDVLTLRMPFTQWPNLLEGGAAALLDPLKTFQIVEHKSVIASDCTQCLSDDFCLVSYKVRDPN